MSDAGGLSGLSGKVALITGAGGMKGVGRAVALKFARLGVDLALSDVTLAPEDMHPNQVRTRWRGIESVAEEVRALGVRCLPIACDLGDRAEIEALVRQAVGHFGHIDILVNNARAIMGKDRVPVTELSEEVWDHFLAINLTAPFLLTKLVAQEMIRHGKGGRIINIGSDLSKRATPMGAAYGATKHGLFALTQAAALDLARFGITVNCPCPGPINTDRISYWEKKQAEERGVAYEAFRAEVVERSAAATPLGRIAEPEDVANLVAFLASDEASFITGQAYNVNGGLLFH
jgi:3-oxoacyl-[acyl-carrier protein] reductase/meso-butanediol dehydrogenase/(S,S)-butanediol dehydrogenase/diacetyl reductase